MLIYQAGLNFHSHASDHAKPLRKYFVIDISEIYTSPTVIDISILAPSLPIVRDLQMDWNMKRDLKDDEKLNIVRVGRSASNVDSRTSTKEAGGTFVPFAEEHPIVSRQELWSYYGEFNLLLITLMLNIVNSVL